jgi:hypothetical protein
VEVTSELLHPEKLHNISRKAVQVFKGVTIASGEPVVVKVPDSDPLADVEVRCSAGRALP